MSSVAFKPQWAWKPLKQSPEYIAYNIFAVAIVVYMFYAVSTICFTEHATLASGTVYMQKPLWIFAPDANGRAFFGLIPASVGYDLNDHQWRNFSQSVVLIPALLCYALGARYIRSKHEATNTITAKPAVVPPCEVNGQAQEIAVEPADALAARQDMMAAAFQSSLTNPPASNRILEYYYVIGGGIFVTYLHGPRVVFLFALLLFNHFVIAQSCRFLSRKWFLLGMWVFHVSILFINEHYHGYSFASMFGNWIGDLFDPIGGGLTSRPRSRSPVMSEVIPWNVLFNMSTLRMIAYCVDFADAVRANATGATASTITALEQKHKTTCLECLERRAPCYKLRTEAPRSLTTDFGVVNYLSFMLYIPLYIAGPMISYNSFISHRYQSQRFFSLDKDCVQYGFKVVRYMCSLIVLLHYLHLNAIKAHPTMFFAQSIGFKASVFMMTLGFLWLKFSIFWKFFRLIALIDGVEAPEDMVRCFSDTVTVADFWRDWHASFNVWIIRYMYIPLGGNKSRMLSIFPIFMFIAIWHDIEMNLFFWALIMCLAFIPEILIAGYFSSPKRFGWLRIKPYYQRVKGVASAAAIFALILANLIGFGTGAEKTTSTKTAEVVDDNGPTAFTYVQVITCVFVYFYTAAMTSWRRRGMFADDIKKRKLAIGVAEPIRAKKAASPKTQDARTPLASVEATF